MILVLIVLLVFIGITVLLITIVAESGTVRVTERIERVQRKRVVMVGSPLAQQLEKPLWDRAVAPVVDKLRRRILEMTPEGMAAGIRQKLEQAGITGSISVASFVTIRILFLGVGVLAALWVGLTWELSPLMKIMAAGVLVLAGVTGLDVMLNSKIRARQAIIKKSLPDMIDLLVVSTEAGTGLDGALATAIERKEGPLSDEFARVLTEIRLGKSRHEAWEDLARRVGLTDLNMLVAALRQAEQLGVSIANTLRTQADALRTRRSIAIRQVAASLGIKMLFPLIFCILPAMFVVVLGPGLMTLSSAFTGLGW